MERNFGAFERALDPLIRLAEENPDEEDAPPPLESDLDLDPEADPSKEEEEEKKKKKEKGVEGAARDYGEISNVDRLEQLGEFSLWGELGEKECHRVAQAILRRALDWMEAGKRDAGIVLSLNSVGGSVSDGLALGAQLQRVQAMGYPVVIFVVGQVNSMATILLQFANKRVLHKAATVHMHDISYVAWGDSHHIADHAFHAASLRKRVARILAKRSGRHDAKWWMRNVMDRTEHYWTAKQALKMGLADDLSGWTPDPPKAGPPTAGRIDEGDVDD